jgi:hypothetical protein
MAGLSMSSSSESKEREGGGGRSESNGAAVPSRLRQNSQGGSRSSSPSPFVPLSACNSLASSVSSLPPSPPSPQPSAPSFHATVDQIMHDHSVSAREVIQDQDLLEELLAEIERDCEGLRSFLYAAQVCLVPSSCGCSLVVSKAEANHFNFLPFLPPPRSSTRSRIDPKTPSSASANASPARSWPPPFETGASTRSSSRLSTSFRHRTTERTNPRSSQEMSSTSARSFTTGWRGRWARGFSHAERGSPSLLVSFLALLRRVVPVPWLTLAFSTFLFSFSSPGCRLLRRRPRLSSQASRSRLHRPLCRPHRRRS